MVISAPPEGRRARPAAGVGIVPPSSAGGERQGVPWFWLVGLTLLATATRAAGAGAGLWWDEAYALVTSFRPSTVEILTVFGGDNQHPLYSLLAHWSIALLGEHAWTARLPALVFGVASVPLLYLLGSVVTRRREALLAAALLAVSYHHVWFSQNARGYTALAFFAMLSTYLLLRAIRESRPALFAGYAVVAALGAYTHLTMVFLVAGQALAYAWMLLMPRGEWRPRNPILGLVAFPLAGLLTLLLYAPILPQVLDFFLNRPSGLRGVSTPAWALREGLRVLGVGFGASGGLLVGAVFFFCGVLSYARRSLPVALLFLLPGLTTLVGALLTRGTMYPRFFFFLAGFAVLIVVRGAVVVGESAATWLSLHNPARDAVGIALVALMVMGSASMLPRNYRMPKQDFEGALRWVEANRAPGEQIVTAGVVAFPYRELFGRDWPSVQDVAAFRALRVRDGSTWLLYTFPMYLEHAQPELMAAIREECPVVGIFAGTVGGGDVVVCRP